MKRFFSPTAFLILAVPAATFAHDKVGAINARENHVHSSGTKKPRDQAKVAADEDQRMLARVTVYWARGGSGSDRFTRQHKAATGIRLKGGHCAVDPRRIPYGSQIVFPDARLLAVDTGTAVMNRKAARLSGRTRAEQNAVVVDRFFETKAQAERWEKTHPSYMMVRVIPPKREMPAQRYVETNFPRAIPVDGKFPKAIAANDKVPRGTLVVKK